MSVPKCLGVASGPFGDLGVGPFLFVDDPPLDVNSSVPDITSNSIAAAITSKSIFGGFFEDDKFSDALLFLGDRNDDGGGARV